MSIFSLFEQKIKKSIEAIDLELKSDLKLDKLSVELPRDPSHGDLATNAAMVLAKQVGINPRQLADIIVAELVKDDDVASAVVAGPGFINIVAKPEFWFGQLAIILKEQSNFGRSTMGNGQKVNVEYVSANPTGPMHVGHCRGAVVGDALANLLDFAGYDVTREYYVNDAGGQIEVLARSVFLRYREALGEEIGKIPEGLYPGDYLKPIGQDLAEIYSDKLLKMSDDEWLPIVKPAAIEAMMDLIRADLDALDVRHDVFFSERSLHKVTNNKSKIDEAIEDLREKGFVYLGTLPPPKGQKSEDWEDREQLLFRSTDVGDGIDRPLVKPDGSYTYFAADVAYFLDKYQRGFDEMIFVLGADHGGYVKRLQAVANAVSGGKSKLTVRLCQMVKLFRDGKPLKMSKRSGEFITLRKAVDEVGSDAVRFMMLYRKNDMPLDFDFSKVVEQSKDNPVFYVQYAHARCCSVFRQAAREVAEIDTSFMSLGSVDLSLLSDETEIELIKKLSEYPKIIEAAAVTHEPHRIAFYLFELASGLHAHWNRGKDRSELRFINPKLRELTLARLALVSSIRSVLASGLAVIGAEAPEEMR
jgi:arginyl-tRNA synthetase